MSFILSCCSTADMPAEYYEKRDIKYVCFHFELDGKNYIDDLGKTMSMKEFYDAMRNGAMTKTSQVNAEEYEAYFENALIEVNIVLELTEQVILPFITNKIKIETTIPVALKLIQGSVPNYYLNGINQNSTSLSLPIE